MQNSVIKFNDPPSITSSASVVGRMEKEGPLGEIFDFCDPSDRFGRDTWERSESEMQRLALNFALSKNKLSPDDIDAVFAGDLINQCTSSTYGLCEYDIPYFGIYGACSTVAEGLIAASMSIDGGYFRRCAAVTSSHNCTAERQFRAPLEHGSNRTPTSQWTVTGAAAFILSDEAGKIRITEALVGRTVDSGLSDISNMGAAMAPAAIDTLTRYFRTSGASPEDLDAVVTGDLGNEGHSIMLELLQENDIDISANALDCGLMIFDRGRQDVHAGGSGCGCGASVLASHFLPKIISGEIRDMLFIATGALMSPLTIQQGDTIPAIAHLIRLSGKDLEI
ncbi:MAG: stage V sporulation protein AD [Clostridia bacterium]|nr:stage V sporulation protein AD [Clostridia bacterium]